MRDESAIKPVESLARLYSPATDVPSCSDASVPVACAACPGQTRNRCKPEINQAGRHAQGKWERGGQEGERGNHRPRPKADFLTHPPSPCSPGLDPVTRQPSPTSRPTERCIRA